MMELWVMKECVLEVMAKDFCLSIGGNAIFLSACFSTLVPVRA